MRKVYVLTVGGRPEKHFQHSINELFCASGNKKRLKELAKEYLKNFSGLAPIMVLHTYSAKFGSAQGRVEFRKREDETISETEYFYGVY